MTLPLRKIVLQRPQNNMQLTQVAVYTENISFTLKIYMIALQLLGLSSKSAYKLKGIIIKITVDRR